MPFFQLHNPVPYEIRDPDEVHKWINKYRFIPYYGTEQYSSHAFLYLLRDLCELSPTHASTIDARQEYTFGHNLEIVGRSFPGLAGEEVDIDFASQLRFGEYLLALGLPLTKINALSREMDSHLAECGNAYLCIKRARTGGAVSYAFEVLDYLHTGYVQSDDQLEQFIINTPFLFDQSKLDKYPPDIYRVTPAGEALRWMTTGDGMEATVVHLKVKPKAGGGKLYGRPKMIGFLPWYYVDFQDGNHTSKIAAAEMVTKKLLAIMGEDPNAINDTLDDEGKAVDTFEANVKIIKEVTTSMTTKGNRLGPKAGQASVGVLEYPFSGTPPVDIDLEMNRDVKYLQHQGDRASDRVAACLGWDTILTSFRQANASLGGNLLYDTFVLKDIETVQPIQRFFENFWNGIVGQVMEEQGAPNELRAIGVRFPAVIANLVESLKPAAPSSTMPAVTDPATEETEIDE